MRESVGLYDRDVEYLDQPTVAAVARLACIARITIVQSARSSKPVAQALWPSLGVAYAHVVERIDWYVGRDVENTRRRRCSMVRQSLDTAPLIQCIV